MKQGSTRSSGLSPVPIQGNRSHLRSLTLSRSAMLVRASAVSDRNKRSVWVPSKPVWRSGLANSVAQPGRRDHPYQKRFDL
ncbi:hypothetical protein DPMN_079736 [Dreissena polymorpha]|uniref:Uncharacterized protein n=1 Tax=Dreissena polymorpha TaxID=45954 RepID=A0A9D3YRA6_DREPO|nr:hypothetical protein DPMN_079736 [Dreissena polymorpha]